MTNPASGKVLAPANIGRFPQSGNGDCHLPQTGHPLVPWHSPLPQKTHPKSDIQTRFLPKSTIFAALHSYCHAAMFAQKTISLLLFCLFCPAPFLHARNSFPPAVSPQSRIHAPQKDSAFFSRKDAAHPDPTASRRMKAPDALGMAFTGVPLVITGVATKSVDDRFRSLRNSFMPAFRCKADDFLQYLPAAAMAGMKAFGVESRSSWGRMLVSDAFSAILMAGIVNSLKATTHVERPDGSNRHSFPSGHTATAFMTATMLNKEYGYISPWIGIGAYSVAAATGMMRIANNKHWLSDVLAGAGTGIIATEIGYLLADLIFKEKGIDHALDFNHFSRDTFAVSTFNLNPSFLGVYLGLASMPGRYQMNGGHPLKFLPGSSVGIEGAYFFNPHIGAGGIFGLSDVPFSRNTMAAGNSAGILSVYSGAYFSYPVMDCLLVGGNISVGYVHSNASGAEGTPITKKDWVSISPGLSLTFRSKEHFGLKLFARYELMPGIMPGSSPNTLHLLAFGAAASILFPNAPDAEQAHKVSRNQKNKKKKTSSSEE